jgi:hypothetical protein
MCSLFVVACENSDLCLWHIAYSYSCDAVRLNPLVPRSQVSTLHQSHVINERVEHSWNNFQGRNSCPNATLSTTTWTALGLNPGLHGEKQATDRISYDMIMSVTHTSLRNKTAKCIAYSFGSTWRKMLTIHLDVVRKLWLKIYLHVSNMPSGYGVH